jgi:hypothetical protein
MPAEQEMRLLIVTGAAVAEVEELPPAVRSLIESASEILVVTPVLPGRLQWLASDTDRVRYEAVGAARDSGATTDAREILSKASSRLTALTATPAPRRDSATAPDLRGPSRRDCASKGL